MELIWIAFAFFFGLAARSVRLPPLVGYLMAGFILNYFHFHESERLNMIADVGITLMLFSIGLSLKIKDLLKWEVLAVGTTHIILWSIIIVGLITGLTLFIPQFSGLTIEQSATIGFILSFSSTICVIKLLQEHKEIETRHSKVSISILVLQDLVAVLYLVYSTGKIPSIWALALPLLVLLSPILRRIVKMVGHGELLPLMGILLAFSGYHLFELVNIKGDLGALVLGMLLGSNLKGNELGKSLMIFKDLFLIAFFLTIGLIGLPSLETVSIALLLSVIILLKFVLFFALLAFFNMRSRHSFLISILLSNYGEFGLIVAYIANSDGLIDNDWMIIIGLSVAITFVITSICYHFVHDLYSKVSDFLYHFQTTKVLPEDITHYPPSIEVLVVGTGRVGSSALTQFQKMEMDNVWGLDPDKQRIEKIQAQGFNIFAGDAGDIDLWRALSINKIKIILLAIPSIDDCLSIVNLIKQTDFQGKIIAVAQFEDDRRLLRKSGVHAAFNIFKEAGAKFAEDSINILETSKDLSK